MKKIIRFAETVRNNWKKSLFATCVLSYGANYAKNSYDTKLLMREYCKTAEQYGLLEQPAHVPPKRITVILNPAANKRRCKALFDKYCAPLLYLAGFEVTVVQTEFIGHAKELPEKLNPNTDIIVVAGGDGTLAETVTGLFRRAEGNLKALKNLPIGVLPLGRTNSVARCLVTEKEQVKALADATFAIIDGSLKAVDVMKIDPLEGEGKPVFGLAKIEWGIHRNVKAKRDRYWLFGPFRDYISYLFNNSAKAGEWSCFYSEPCSGCLTCVETVKGQRKWWQSFLPVTQKNEKLLSVNEKCGKMLEQNLSTVSLEVATKLLSHQHFEASGISLHVGPEELSRVQVIREGWSKIRDKEDMKIEGMPIKQLHLVPKEVTLENWFHIDSEDFEVKPVAVSVIPESLMVFEPKGIK